jgi:ATP-dependent Clp protease ATP-binding subunit ClpC
MGAGAAEGAVDALTSSPSLAREIADYWRHNLDDYRKYIERDAAPERRFQPVLVAEPSVDEATEILKGISSVTKSTIA